VAVAVPTAVAVVQDVPAVMAVRLAAVAVAADPDRPQRAPAEPAALVKSG
jgi:hypothetical protein